MTGYPDVVAKLIASNRRAIESCTTGRSPGLIRAQAVRGNQARITRYEDWKIGSDELIADSNGHYDALDWDRQLNLRCGRNGAMGRS